MKRLKRIAKWTALFFCGLGCLWFCLPLLRGGFGIGSEFGIFICLLGAALLLFYPGFAARGGWKKALARLVLSGYVIGLAWAALLTGWMVSVQFAQVPQNANVIVLGAQVHADGHMSLSLAHRIDCAARYLLENPESMCIVAGGLGDDEPCPEAETMARALMDRGVGEERILLEDRSRNTRQNFLYSAELAQEHGLGTEFVIITQNFHLYRAAKLAESAGLEPIPLAAYTDPLMLPQYYGRELLSLTKWAAEQLVLGQ